MSSQKYFPYFDPCKDNQTMKFGQLIELNMRNIFSKHTQNVKKLVPDTYKKTEFSIGLDSQSKILCRLFLLYDRVKGYEIILKVRC